MIFYFRGEGKRIILKPEDFKHMLAWPTVLITTQDKDGIANAAPYGCVMPVLRPLDLVSITSAYQRDTLNNIRATKEFTLNIPGVELAEQTMFCARPLSPAVNEITAAGLSEIQGIKVKVPRIAECLGWIECILEEEIARENYVIVVGKVLHAEVKDQYYQNGDFDLTNYQPLYSGWNGKMMSIGKAVEWKKDEKICCGGKDKNG